MLYWPDWEGAWTVNVRTVIPGARDPTAIVLLEVETWVEPPPFTDSVQPTKAKLAKSPDETTVELLKAPPAWLYIVMTQVNVEPDLTLPPEQEGAGMLTPWPAVDEVEVVEEADEE